MVDRKEFQVDPKKFPDKPKFLHAEHVIQDSLYGRLKSSDILCETCGSQLSKEVDADFGKIFQSISEQFATILASTEKNKNYEPSLKGHVILRDKSKVPVFIKGGIIYPQRPFYDAPVEGVVKVYGEKKAATNFINVAKNELGKQGQDIDKLKFVISSLDNHVELGINFSEGIEDFNHKFKMGFIKIATGYAMMNGVDRGEVPNTIDTVTNKLTYTDQILPYVPCEAFEMIYDQQRIALEPEFPNHTLILYVDDFGEKRKLICYVDLFSTFAFYVVLNNDYKGKDVHATYQQSITKMEAKPEIIVRNQSPKKLLIIEDFLGIKKEELNGLSLEQRYEYVQKRYDQYTVSYEMDLAKTFRSASERIALNVAARKTESLDLLGRVEREMLESLPEFEIEDLMLIREEYVRLENEDPAKIYRQNHVTSRDKEMFIHSNFYEIIERQHKDMASITRYTTAKFNILAYYIENIKSQLASD